MKTHPWRELREELRKDPEMEARIEEHKRALDDALRLAELRSHRGQTQKRLAAALNVSQSNISQIERTEDPYLSTLQSYVQALGGELHVLAIFPDETVSLDLPSPTDH